MLDINLKGKRALVAGVADDAGFGFAIAKSLAEAGASICLATWPPALGIFETLLRRHKLDDSLKLQSGGSMCFEKIYALDAAYDSLQDVPSEVREHKRYKDRGDFSIRGLAEQAEADFGKPCFDILVHSLANGPEVKSPLLDTSRAGYLAALSASAYSLTSLVHHIGPLMRQQGAVVSLSYMAAERVVAGYGGGMSSAKAALQSDTRVLSFEAGRRWGLRVNSISAGPFASRAASSIGMIERMIDYCREHSPLAEQISAQEVGNVAAFLCSPLASGITGSVIYVDKGYHAMGAPADLAG